MASLSSTSTLGATATPDPNWNTAGILVLIVNIVLVVLMYSLAIDSIANADDHHQLQ